MMKPYSSVSTLCLEKTNNRNLVYHIPMLLLCAHVCVFVWRIQYYDCMMWGFFKGFKVYIIVDPVKHGVLTFVGEMQHYRNNNI